LKGILRTKIPQALDALSSGAQVLAPMKINGVSRFACWGQQGELVLGASNTLIPPKDAVFGQTEKMYKYQMGQEAVTIEEIPQDGPQLVVFGIRPCDVRSIQALDQVFLTKGFVDQIYKTKRDRSVLVALGCSQPQQTCFCSSMGINPLDADGADVMMWESGDTYSLEARTDKGKDLLAKLEPFLTDVNNSSPPSPKFSLEFSMEGVTEKLQKMFEHSIWDKWYRKCLGCGICTYVCPTCHCFDIQEKNIKDGQGYKFRCWDSCMFPEYSLMAGGHNPRDSKKPRIRNRFLHKLRYFPERYGMLLCTGCGRCLRECPVNMDITRFIREVREVTLDV